ncbi:7TM diverse intracellular signaling domain-containing protein [Isoalcanivorax beigongshangi]|uniref:histidine kinase n=1 Tax=Isoalcanivorax beigongshangi TaxID=3238810 RepID=A0ABV4AIR5_9GAMM
MTTRGSLCRHLARLMLWLVIACTGLAARADLPLPLSVDSAVSPAALHAAARQLCLPAGAALAPDTLLSQYDDTHWQPLPRSGLNAGFTDQQCWLQLTLTRSPPQALTLKVDNALLQHLDLYLRDASGRQLAHQQAGLAHPGAGLPSFLIPAQPATVQLLLRADSEAGLALPLSLHPRGVADPGRQRTLLLHSLLLGAVLLLGLYNAVLGWALRERSYLYYSLWTLAAGTLVAVLQGYPQQWLWPQVPQLSLWLLVTLLPLLVMLPTLFLPHFLDLRRLWPAGQRGLALLCGSGVMLLLAALFLPLRWVLPLQFALLLLFNLVALLCLLVAARRGLADGAVLTLAWLAPALGTTVLALRMGGVLPDSGASRYLLELALVSNLLLMAPVLAGRIRRLETQRAKSQAAQESARREALQASSLNQAKSEFLATMTHQVRTPVNGALRMTELLRRSDPSESQRQYLHSIEHSLQSLVTVLNDILDYSQIETGQLGLEEMEVSMESLLDECVSQFALLATGKQLPLHTFLDSRVPDRLRLDPVRFKQVITNLLSNAFKWTASGHVSLHVSLQQPPDATGRCQVMVEITDTGDGLDTSQQRRLLGQDGSVLPTSERRRGNGTGLGLPISRQLVQLMGGELGINSAPGRGATFWFTVRAQEAPGRWQGQGLFGASLLVASPDPLLTLSVSQMASRWGMVVSECATLDDARDLLQRTAPDALLLDPCFHDQLANIPLALRPRAMVLAQPAGVELAPPDSEGTEVIETPLRALALRQCLQHLLHRSTTESPASDAPQRRDSTRRVLVVEPNPVNQLVLDAILKTAGLRATLCGQADDAAALLSSDQAEWDVVFLDTDHAALQNGQLAQLRREAEQQHGLPRAWLVALGTRISSTHVQRAREVGMDDYLGKPVSHDQVLGALQRAASAAR